MIVVRNVFRVRFGEAKKAIETEHESLAAWEQHDQAAMADDAIKEWYGRAKAVVEEGYREVLQVKA